MWIILITPWIISTYSLSCASNMQVCEQCSSKNEQGISVGPGGITWLPKSHIMLACINRNAMPIIGRGYKFDFSRQTIRAATHSVFVHTHFKMMFKNNHLVYNLNSCLGLHDLHDEFPLYFIRLISQNSPPLNIFVVVVSRSSLAHPTQSFSLIMPRASKAPLLHQFYFPSFWYWKHLLWLQNL